MASDQLRHHATQLPIPSKLQTIGSMFVQLAPPRDYGKSFRIAWPYYELG